MALYDAAAYRLGNALVDYFNALGKKNYALAHQGQIVGNSVRSGGRSYPAHFAADMSPYYGRNVFFIKTADNGACVVGS